MEEYNIGKKRKILIVSDDMIADLINNIRKLNISIAFITQSYFKVTKDVKLNSIHFFIIKIPNKKTATNCIKSLIRY